MQRRKLVLAVALLALVVAAAVPAGWAANPSQKLPQVALETAEHSFGSIPQGTPLSYTFKLKNRGKGDLRILSVKPSCGCTKGDFDSLTAPGKSGQVTLSIAHTESYVGKIVKTATVTTNDPQHQSFVLTLRADFVPKQPGAPETQ
jgi:hypothetical protein